MPTSTNVTNLKINELTESQYDSAVQGGVIGANELSILTDVDAGQVIQVATLPTASADELGNIYQFVGTTDANYTNGYFYKCVSDGQQPATYSWTRVDVQPQAGGLPDQTGQSGKFLTTNGTDASWDNTVAGELKISSSSKAVSLQTSGTMPFRLYTRPTPTSTQYQGSLVYQHQLNYMYWIMGINGSNAYNFSSSSFRPYGSNVSLGESSYKWGNVYTQKLNNGSDITVPAVAGSMAVQVSTIPTAASTLEGQIYQFVGTTDSTYTNGYFYKCVSDGSNPATYSWEAVQVQAGGGSSLPSQTGNSGKFLTTDGTDASWSDKPLVNTATGTGGLTIVGTPLTKGGINIGFGSQIVNDSLGRSVVIGNYAKAGDYTSGISNGGNVAIGTNAKSSGYLSVAIGHGQITRGEHAIQIGTDNATNSDANTFKVANANGNFEIMSADGTIPADRLKNAVNKYSTMPTASASNEGWIVQFTGTTDSTYTHGYLYECVSDGSDPATYSWTAVQMQATGNYLPLSGGTMTGTITYATSGATGDTATKILSTADNRDLIKAGAFGSMWLGSGSTYIASPCPTASGNPLGSNIMPWGTVYARKLNRGTSSADINIPNQAGTMVVADPTGATQGQVLTLDSNLQPTWANAGGGSATSTTATLATADWSSNTQTVSVQGVSSSNTILVAPAPSSNADYVSAGILCTTQSTNSLTFTCQTVPSSAITVNIVILN